MRAAHRVPVYEELTPDECLALLAQAPVGRLGLSIGALPAVLPVNFAVLDGSVVFRTVPGTKLDAATSGTIVAFEADDWNADTGEGWSVMLRGPATVLCDPVDLGKAERLPLESWAFDGAADHFVRVEPVVVTGRRIRSDTST